MRTLAVLLAAPPAAAGSLSLGAAFHLGGVQLHFAYLDDGFYPGWGPGYYVRAPRALLTFAGPPPAACYFRSGGFYYYRYDCPLIVTYFDRYGAGVPYYLSRYRPRYLAPRVVVRPRYDRRYRHPVYRGYHRHRAPVRPYVRPNRRDGRRYDARRDGRRWDARGSDRDRRGRQGWRRGHDRRHDRERDRRDGDRGRGRRHGHGRD